jgi:transcriptional regulator with XRE-family HTH domain
MGKRPAGQLLPISDEWRALARRTCEEKKWSQYRLAREAGIAQSSVNNVLNGKYANGRIARKVADALGIPPPAVLVGFTGTDRELEEWIALVAEATSTMTAAEVAELKAAVRSRVESARVLSPRSRPKK